MTKEVAIKKKESFWERNKKSNGLLLKKRAKSIAISMIPGQFYCLECAL